MIYPQNQTSVKRVYSDKASAFNSDDGHSTRIRLADLPDDIRQKLKHLDLANDGFIDAADVIHIDEKDKQEMSEVINI